VAKGAEQLEEAKKNRYISMPTKEEDTSTGGASNFSALDYAGTIDFTYDKATDWYKNSLLKPLLDMGVTCINTDFGENIHMDHQYHGMTPERLNNIYSLLYQRAAFEVTKEVTGNGIVWARSAWAGCQRYPLHWGGDSASSWDGLAGSLKGGLHFGLSGFAFWSHDVPGFHSIPDFMNSPIDENVYVRWTQFGVFSSHMRYHGTCKREPWHYPRIAPIVKRWWKLRYKLLPYIIEQGEQSCLTGYPMVRALLMHHPHNRQVWHIDDEYYFGNDFLVCPVMNACHTSTDESKNGVGTRDIYLPEGQWIDFFTGRQWQGGQWYYNVEVPLDRMPVFVRPGARIKVYPDDVDCTDQMDLDKATAIEITEDFKGIDF
jgi:alpha-D-xyloside xylohydrolase